MGLIFDRLPGNSGVLPREVTCDLIVGSGGVTAGLVYTLDMTTALDATYGVATTSGAIAASTTIGNIYVVATETADAAATARFVLQGWVSITGAGALSGKQACSVDSAGKLIAAATESHVLAISGQGTAAAGTKVWFDGTGGFSRKT